MVSTLLASAALVAASAVLGQAFVALCGFRGWRPWAPVVGFAVLVAIGAQLARVPGRTGTLIALTALLVVATLFVPGVVRGLREALPQLPLAAGVLLVSGVPFYANGSAGVLGVNVSNDMSAHLVTAFWLRTGDGSRPVGALQDDLIAQGYPIGPHGVVATLVELTGMPETYAFSAFTLAVPVLTALAALTVLPARPRLGRFALAAIVGLAYLATAYTTQGSFKETVMGLTLVAAGVVLSDMVRDRDAGAFRRGAPLGVLIAGGAYAYSYGGVVWPLGAALLVLALEAYRSRRALARFARAATIAASGTALAFVLAAGLDFARMMRFADSAFAVMPRGRTANLYGALPPVEAVGIWFVGDFRFTPDPAWPSYALAAIGLGALLLGLPWWWRRAAVGPPAALASGVVVWGQLALTRNVYGGAKGLAILAPVLVLCIGGPLLAAWSARARSKRPAARLLLARAVGIALLAGAAASSFALLRDAAVGLGSQDSSLGVVRNLARGQPVLFIGIDHFMQWELRGTRLQTTGAFYSPAVLPTRAEKPFKHGKQTDVDNFEPRTLDRVDWIVISDGYQSAMPPNFRLERRAGSLLLFRRTARTPEREVLEPSDAAGAVLRCDTPKGRSALARFRTAAVLPTPLIYSQRVWRGQPVVPGRSATARVALPPGRWDVSLQYVSPTGLDVRGGGLRRTLPSWFGRINSFWSAGTVTSRGRALEIRVTARRLPWFGRLVGASRQTRATTSPNDLPLNRLAFTRHGSRPRLVPVAEACGRWVDYVSAERER